MYVLVYGSIKIFVGLYVYHMYLCELLSMGASIYLCLLCVVSICMYTGVFYTDLLCVFAFVSIYGYFLVGLFMYEVLGGEAKMREVYVSILVSDQYLASTNQDSVFTSLGVGVEEVKPLRNSLLLILPHPQTPTKMPCLLRRSWISE